MTIAAAAEENRPLSASLSGHRLIPVAFEWDLDVEIMRRNIIKDDTVLFHLRDIILHCIISLSQAEK